MLEAEEKAAVKARFFRVNFDLDIEREQEQAREKNSRQVRYLARVLDEQDFEADQAEPLAEPPVA